jgi:hypothetical protein
MPTSEEDQEIHKLLDKGKMLIDNDRVKMAITYRVLMNGENYCKYDIM